MHVFTQQQIEQLGVFSPKPVPIDDLVAVARSLQRIESETGNLTNVRTNAQFPFGVAMLPASKQRGSPTGGGNWYLFKKSTPAEREAAFQFIKWITAPERAAPPTNTRSASSAAPGAASSGASGTTTTSTTPTAMSCSGRPAVQERPSTESRSG